MSQKKKLAIKLATRHILPSAIGMLIWIFIFFANDYRFFADRGTTFFINNYLIGFIIYFVILSIVASPFILAAYFSYQCIISRTFLYKLLAPALLILSATIIPTLFLWHNIATRDSNYTDWGGLLALIFFVNNFFLLIINEVVLALNWKKI